MRTAAATDPTTQTAAQATAATVATRRSTVSTCRLECLPVAHHVAKCSQLATTGQ